MGKEDLPNGNGNEEGQAQPEAPQTPTPTPEEIVTHEVVETVVKGYNEDCDLVDFSVKLGTQIGDNYMSIMYAVDINMKNRKTMEEENINVMLKTMPRNEVRLQMINDSGAFIKDANMYKEVLPRMVAFQKERGLKDEEMFTAWPKCFTTFHDGKSDYLGMEDLKFEGYKMANRMTGLDPDHTHLVLSGIAKFHALSYAMFGGDSSKIMTEYPWLEEKMFPTLDKVQEPMKMWFKASMDQEAEIVRKEGYEKEAKMMESVVDDSFWSYMNDLLGGTGKHAVINHGDCWTNNMMFKYDGDKPKNIKFVDFQLSRCAPRSIDLGYFFHSSIPMLTFNAKEEDLLKFYHEEFTSFFKKLGSDPDEYGLTWETLKEEYKYGKWYGVLMGLMLAPILSAEASAVPDMEQLKEEDMTGEGAKDFWNQLSGNEANKKIVNLAVNHLPRCPQMANK